MKAFQSVSAKLLAAFNAANNSTITMNQVSFKDVRPVDSITPRPNTTKNTAITMVVSDSSPYPGEVTLFYDRLNISVPANYAPLGSSLSIKATVEKTIHDLLPLINRRLGTELTKEEVVDRPLYLDKGFDTISVVMTGKSNLFIGSIKLLVVRDNDPVSDLIVPYMGELWYKDHIDCETTPNNPLTQKWPPALRTYLSDYSAQAEFLKTIPAFKTYTPITDTALGVNLANAMKAVDGLAWVFTSTKTIANLWRCWVIYNGPTEEFDLSHYVDEAYFGEAVDPMRKDEFDNVMVLRNNNPWNDTYGYRSCIVLHYNNEVA